MILSAKKSWDKNYTQLILQKFIRNRARPLKYLSKLTIVQETIFRPTKYIFDPFHSPMSVSPGDALISLSSSSSSSLFSFHPFAGKGGGGEREGGDRGGEVKERRRKKYRRLTNGNGRMLEGKPCVPDSWEQLWAKRRMAYSSKSWLVLSLIILILCQRKDL